MSRLKLRTFSIAILLVSASLGMALNFTSSLLAGTNTDFEGKSELQDLRENFGNKSNTIRDKGLQQTKGTDVQTDFFFLRSVWNTIISVVKTVTNLPSLITGAAGITGLAVPASVQNLFGVIIIGVVFAVIAAARGWDV